VGAARPGRQAHEPPVREGRPCGPPLAGRPAVWAAPRRKAGRVGRPSQEGRPCGPPLAGRQAVWAARPGRQAHEPPGAVMQCWVMPLPDSAPSQPTARLRPHEYSIRRAAKDAATRHCPSSPKACVRPCSGGLACERGVAPLSGGTKPVGRLPTGGHAQARALQHHSHATREPAAERSRGRY